MKSIKLTPLQHDQLMAFKNIGSGCSTFMFKQANHEVPAFPEFITTEREDELMQALLHPELIELEED